MKYNANAVVEKNITLSFEFERYLLEHPESLEHIPSGAEIVLLPKYDSQLYRINLASARKAKRKDRKAKIIFVEVDDLVPLKSRLVNPKVKARPTLRLA